MFAPATGDALAEWNRRVTSMIRHGELRLASERTSPDGRQRDQWFAQRYKGVQVDGTEVWRRLEGRRPMAIEGTIYTGIDIDPVPKLTRSEALDRFAELAGGSLGPSLQPELAVLPIAGGGYRLVYQARVFTGPALTRYSIDASKGDVVAAEAETGPPPP